MTGMRASFFTGKDLKCERLKMKPLPICLTLSFYSFSSGLQENPPIIMLLMSRTTTSIFYLLSTKIWKLRVFLGS
jgi:hypothetical protein